MLLILHWYYCTIKVYSEKAKKKKYLYNHKKKIFNVISKNFFFYNQDWGGVLAKGETRILILNS